MQPKVLKSFWVEIWTPEFAVEESECGICSTFSFFVRTRHIMQHHHVKSYCISKLMTSTVKAAIHSVFGRNFLNQANAFVLWRAFFWLQVFQFQKLFQASSNIYRFYSDLNLFQALWSVFSKPVTLQQDLGWVLCCSVPDRDELTHRMEAFLNLPMLRRTRGRCQKVDTGNHFQNHTLGLDRFGMIHLYSFTMYTTWPSNPKMNQFHQYHAQTSPFIGSKIASIQPSCQSLSQETPLCATCV